MARTLYAGRPGDYFVGPTGAPIRRGAAPVYKTPDGSQPVIDLLDEAGLPVTAVTSDGAGGFTFYGPENYRGVLYLRDQNGRYKLVEPADMAQRVDDLETSLDANVAAALATQVPAVLGELEAVTGWKPNTAYTIGQPVLNPAGDVVRAKIAFTAGSVYDPTKWDASLTAANDVTARLAALIDAAPAQLNTLNELAAALGDDANFGATVTTALAAKLDATALPAAVTALGKVAKVQATAPVAPADKDLWVDTANDSLLKRYDLATTTWKQAGIGTYAFAPRVNRAPGRKWCFLGDSITAGSNASNAIYGISWVAARYAGTALVREDSINAGKPGDRSDGGLARFDAEVAALAPQGLFIMFGTNDVGFSVPLETYAANMSALVDKSRALGIPVVIGTVPPLGASAGDPARLRIDEYNTWLRLWAPSKGVTLADTFGALVDPATGDMLAAYDSGDGVHPNTAGHLKLGVAVARAIKAITPAQPWLVAAPTKRNLIANPLMAGAGAIATAWADATWLGSNGTVPTFSIETDTTTTLPAGRWQKIAWVTAAASVRLFQATIAGSWAAGANLLVCAHIQVEDIAGWTAARAAGTANVSLYVYDSGAGTIVANPVPRIDAVGAGPVAVAVVVAPGHAGLALVLRTEAPTGVTVNVRLGAVGVFDLTAMALTIP